MENDAMPFLILTWIVQGVINSNKSAEIQRLTAELKRLRAAFEDTVGSRL
jgi:hypothetical protein